MMKNKIDYSIYLVTDRDLMSSGTLEKAVTESILGGCTLVQLREKNITSLDFYNTALAIKNITDKHNVPLIINDRLDIALAMGADGVHVGQSDLSAAIVRSIIGDKMILGVSVSNIAEAEKAQNDGADYLGVGAMFPTDTKTDAMAVSLEELKAIRSKTTLPIVVIGGINKINAGIFKPLGIDGLAVVSAIISKPDIKAATIEIKSIFNGRV